MCRKILLGSLVIDAVPTLTPLFIGTSCGAQLLLPTHATSGSLTGDAHTSTIFLGLLPVRVRTKKEYKEDRVETIYGLDKGPAHIGMSS